MRRIIHAAAIVLNSVTVFFYALNVSQSRPEDLIRSLASPGQLLALVWTLAPLFSLIALVWAWRQPHAATVR